MNETQTPHSIYKNHPIIKVTQNNGRVTWDTQHPDGTPDTWGNPTLAVAKAQIDASRN